MKNRNLLLLLVISAILIQSTTAILTPNFGAGTSIVGYNSTSYIHDSNYALIELVYLFIAIGFLTLITSRALDNGQGLFAIIAPLAFGIAAWYANFMTKETMDGLEIGVNGYALHSEMIISSPVLSVVMIVCLLIAILNILDIFILSVPIKEERKETSEE